MTDVCVVGSFMMDLVVRAPRRPESGETLIGTDFGMFLGGKGFNQAVAASRSGAATSMVGMLGDDEFGRRFRDALAANGIDDAFVRTSADYGTGVAAPLVEESGQNSIVIVPRANFAMTAEAVRSAAPIVEAASVLLLQLELPQAAAVEAARIAHAAGRTVILNPAPAVPDLLGFAGLVDLVVPNEAEATALTGIACELESAGRVTRAIRDQTGAASVVLTLGSRGVVASDGDGLHLVDAHHVEPVDTVGAGDAFCGAMAASLARGDNLETAMRYGNAAGALAVTRHGAEPSMPRRDEVEGLLSAAVA